uniref:Cytochrome P450 n=1 Tax=Mycena chlorophos TaxID=658473 RepID=A0ABQ0L730_MYCCL|nr:cytochrome P450 [Mycena chlorophos]
MPLALEITISLLAIAVLWWSCPLKVKLRGLPPGPWPKPLIGNLLDISFHDPWATFEHWKACFGNVVYVEILGNKLVLLNSLQAVTDLFEKQGVIYSHRPEAIMVGELMGLDQSIGLSNNDRSWKQQRRLVSIALGPKAFKQHAKTQADLAARMILELHQNQADHREIINLAAARLIVQITYGHFIKDMTDPYIIKADQVFDLISSSIRPGAYLVDSLPWCECHIFGLFKPLKQAVKNIPKWIPGSPHRPAAKGKAMFEEFIGVPFEHVKLQMREGRAPPCLVSDLLERPTPVDNLDYKELVKWAAGTMYGSGVDTTSATVNTFILAMLLHPSVQRKAQAELDELLQGVRLPTVEDRDSLPYIGAVIKEVMRWHVILPMGFARRADKDYIYDGHLIPKGSILLPNIRSIAQEGNYLGTFQPEQHLGKEGTVDPLSYAFGFGRRACPGRQLAENSVFIFAASILAAYSINPASEAPLVEPKFSLGLISHPEPFECKFTPRNPSIHTLVKAQLDGRL